MFPFIKLSHQRGFAYEPVFTDCLGDSMVYLCFYLFIFSFFFLNLLYTISEKNVSFDFGEIEGLALNVAKQTE